MTNNEMRYSILAALYQEAVENGDPTLVRGKYLEQYIPLESDGDLVFNLKYLEDHGYITVRWGTWNQIFGIRLTADGIDLIENEDDFASTFQIPATFIIGDHNIVGNNNTRQEINTYANPELEDKLDKLIQELEATPEKKRRGIVDRFLTTLENVAVSTLIEIIRKLLYRI